MQHLRMSTDQKEKHRKRIPGVERFLECRSLQMQILLCGYTDCAGSANLDDSGAATLHYLESSQRLVPARWLPSAGWVRQTVYSVPKLFL